MNTRSLVIVVGIPAYNEEKTIARVILGSQKYANTVIVCDDGSADLTADISERLGAKVIRHEKNKGKGWALRSIFELSVKLKADILITIDADGQHDPVAIPKLIEPLVSGQSDIALGSRYIQPTGTRIPYYRQFGLNIINWLNKKVNKTEIKDSQNGYRAFNSKALKVVSTFESNDFSVESEQIILAARAGLRLQEIYVDTLYDGLEKTSTKFPLTHGMGLVGYILKVMVEDRPLLLLGVPGAICLIVGASFGLWMLQIYAIDHRIVTNVALASMSFIIVGLFSCFSSISLYSISRLSKRFNAKAADNNASD